MKSLIFVILFALVTLRANATSVDPVSVEKLSRDSEIIVIGQIVSGHVLSNDCGIEITVRVTESIKGHYVPDDIVATSVFQEQANIGSERIFFISKTDDQINGITSSNSNDMNLMHASWLRCKDIFPRYAVNLTGMAAPAIVGTYLDDAKQVVEINDFVITPPKGIPSRKEERLKSQDFDRMIDHVWIERTKFIEYLRSVSKVP